MPVPEPPDPPPFDPDTTSTPIPRSTFLVRIGVGIGALLGGAGALLNDLLDSPPTIAASINSSMPAVSKIGLYLGNITSLTPNKALAYKDPTTGDPALVIRLATGHVVSYDVVCPHAGCSVAYDPTHQVLVCPCHGAQFDPVHSAAPLRGPVSQPLITLPIRVDSAGNVYALDAKPGLKKNRLSAAPPPSAGGDDGGGSDGAEDEHTSTKRRRSSSHHRRHQGDN